MMNDSENDINERLSKCINYLIKQQKIDGTVYIKKLCYTLSTLELTPKIIVEVSEETTKEDKLVRAVKGLLMFICNSTTITRYFYKQTEHTYYSLEKCHNNLKETRREVQSIQSISQNDKSAAELMINYQKRILHHNLKEACEIIEFIQNSDIQTNILALRIIKEKNYKLQIFCNRVELQSTSNSIVNRILNSPDKYSLQILTNDNKKYPVLYPHSEAKEKDIGCYLMDCIDKIDRINVESPDYNSKYGPNKQALDNIQEIDKFPSNTGNISNAKVMQCQIRSNSLRKPFLKTITPQPSSISLTIPSNKSDHRLKSLDNSCVSLEANAGSKRTLCDDTIPSMPIQKLAKPTITPDPLNHDTNKSLNKKCIFFAILLFLMSCIFAVLSYYYSKQNIHLSQKRIMLAICLTSAILCLTGAIAITYNVSDQYFLECTDAQKENISSYCSL